MKVPKKKLGKWYVLTVVAASAQPGLLSRMIGSANLVVPELGTDCVCCNLPAGGGTRRVVITHVDPRKTVSTDPVTAPVCANCETHAVPSARFEKVIPFLIVVGGALVLLGATAVSTDLPKALGTIAVGLAIAVPTIFRAVQLDRRAKELLPRGHFVDLRLEIGRTGRLMVVTTNPELMRRLVEGGAIERVD